MATRRVAVESPPCRPEHPLNAGSARAPTLVQQITDQLRVHDAKQNIVVSDLARLEVLLKSIQSEKNTIPNDIAIIVSVLYKLRDSFQAHRQNV